MSKLGTSATVLVTGATGFLGQTIAQALEDRAFPVVRGSRHRAEMVLGKRWVTYGPITADTDWSRALEGVDRVVHLAGVAHLPDNAPRPAADATYEVNTRGTERLAHCAAQQGVRRFVFVSTALVHEARSDDLPITETDPVRPVGAYAQSKAMAEQRLAEAAAGSGMDYVVLRPSLVYGPGAGGNFGRLYRWVRSGWPLPLGRATAPRSFLGIDNLADAVAVCLEHPAAANQSFLVCDDEVSSAAGLIEQMGIAMGRRVLNLPVPQLLMGGMLRSVGRSKDMARLFAPFVLSSRHIFDRLGWRPPHTFAEGVRRAADGRGCQA
jgi:nucleoside-diphosphate-sugar epimerase